MAFVPLNTNNSNLANYNSVNGLMVDYQGFKKAVNTSSAEGWVSGVLPSVSSVAYNGNRSYDITFAGPVTDYLSPGMRLKTVRQVAAPTQCTSLNGSTQYYSKTSPTGLTFTTTFTCMAWVKMTSYAIGGIIARRNADTEGFSFQVESDGRISITGLRIAANNKGIGSYQSIPLNKWVHVAATLDMAAGDTTAQKIWIDGVEVPRIYALNGTATALVQGTTALVVGAQKSDGTNKFPGKIAQAAVFSSQLSDATVKSYYSQGLSGTETNLVSAYSFNGNANDLNTTNANNLTAQASASATNADSPFSVNGSGTPNGTDDYAIVTKVSSTVATVQVPTGCTIPTSGGISATYVSTVKNPFNWVADANLWVVESIMKAAPFQSSPVASTWYNIGSYRITVPIGQWQISTQTVTASDKSGATVLTLQHTLSTASNTESDSEMTVAVQMQGASGTLELASGAPRSKYITTANATVYYFNVLTTTASVFALYLRPTSRLTALPSGL